MKKFHPKGEYVLIYFSKKGDESEKKTKSGIVLPYQEEDSSTKGVSPGKYDFVIHELGPDVKGVKVGDKVIFNEYDMKGLQDDDEYMYALTKESSIMATYE